jgi:tRNA G18 (ribose-2'-O)-methylase SpoU
MPVFVLVVPNVRSAHNVGAMFRTADGAGVDKIYLCGYSPVPPHPQLDKVSLGAEKTVPFEYAKQAGRLLIKLKKMGYNIIALEQTDTSVDLFKFKPQFPLALVVGNEKEGVSKSLQKYCNASVEIPMRGHKNSLNVSVAAGVAMYVLKKKE